MLQKIDTTERKSNKLPVKGVSLKPAIQIDLLHDESGITDPEFSLDSVMLWNFLIKVHYFVLKEWSNGIHNDMPYKSL